MTEDDKESRRHTRKKWNKRKKREKIWMATINNVLLYTYDNNYE